MTNRIGKVIFFRFTAYGAFIFTITLFGLCRCDRINKLPFMLERWNYLGIAFTACTSVCNYTVFAACRRFDNVGCIAVLVNRSGRNVLYGKNKRIAGAARKSEYQLVFALLKSFEIAFVCLLYTSPSPRDGATSRMPSSA